MKDKIGGILLVFAILGLPFILATQIATLGYFSSLIWRGDFEDDLKSKLSENAYIREISYLTLDSYGDYSKIFIEICKSREGRPPSCTVDEAWYNTSSGEIEKFEYGFVNKYFD